MAKRIPSDLSVGEVAARAGVPVSTLHFYEAEGLITSWRTPANHRRFDRSELRRIAIIKVAQSVGVPLSEIARALDTLPKGRKISAEDWAAVSAHWQDKLNDRIALLERLRDQLGHCIGCGCLSLQSCPLYNSEDTLGADGAGPQRWIGRAAKSSN